MGQRQPTSVSSSRRSRIAGWLLMVCLIGGVAMVGCEDKKEAQEGGTSEEPAGEGASGEEAGAGEEAGGEAGGFVAACNRPGENMCSEYHGTMATPEWVTGECEAYKGEFLATPCPTDTAVGRCTRNAGTPQEVHMVWYPPTTREIVEAMCQGEGAEVSDK